MRRSDCSVDGFIAADGLFPPVPTDADPATRGPLRGYVWSENRRRLIRARSVPVPTDSGPPPPVPSPSKRDLLAPSF